MNDQKINLQQLTNNWVLLCTEIKKNGKVNFDMFNATFSETYKILSQTVSETCIEKNLLPLIVNTYAFAHADVSPNIDASYMATLILTDRMLNSVIANDAIAQIDEASIYILESRKEIRINFKEVNSAIEALAEVLNSDYLNKINM